MFSLLYPLLYGGQITADIILSAVAYLISALIVVFLVLPFHEYAHAWMSNKLGDHTARMVGRLSLNPMRHIDWWGAAMIMLFGFGWAKPVPVNMRYFDHPKRDMALTALAGPVSNLLAGFVSLLLGNVVLWLAPVRTSVIWYFVYMLFQFLATINVGLAVFNLLPVPPLDGSRLLTALLPDRMYYRLMQYERFIILALFALLFLGVLDGPLTFLRGGVMSGLRWLADLPFGF